MKNIVLATVLFFAASIKGFSHYLWVETAPTGSINNEQEIKVHYGEYTYGVIEKVNEDAFNAVSNFTLWVTDANGNKSTLKVTEKDDHYVAYYTPTTNGTYTVTLNNNTIDVIDYTQYDFGIFKTHYHSVTKFQVGSNTSATATENLEGLTIKNVPTGTSETKLQVLYKNTPLAKNELKVFVADLWSKTLETDENGFVNFKLPWKTKYVVETTIKEEVPGTYKGEAYEFIWHCATTCMN